MAVQIQIDQVTRPPGLPGQAREDLVLAQPVTLTAIGGPFIAYQWRWIYRAVDIVAAVRSTAVMASPTASSTVVAPIAVEGTYHVELLVDSGSGLGATPDDVARITFYAAAVPLSLDPSLLPRRAPAFQETTEHNVPDAIDPAGNPEGWAREMLRWFAVIKRIASGGSALFARVSLPAGGPASVVSSAGVASVVRSAVGVVDVTFTTPQTNDRFAVIASARGAAGTCSVYNETVNGFRLARGDAFGVLTDADFAFDVKAAP